MPDKGRLHHALLIAAALVAFVFVVSSLHRFFPYEAVDFEIDRLEAIDIGETYLNGLGFDVSDYEVMTRFIFENKNFAYLQENLGLESAVDMVRNSHRDLFGPKMRVQWFRNLPKNAPQQSFRVDVSPDGRVVGYQHVVPEEYAGRDSTGSHLEEEEAKVIAIDFMKTLGIDLADFKLDFSANNRFENRIDYYFLWKAPLSEVEGEASHNVRVQGNEIGRYACWFELPEAIDFAKREKEGNQFFFGLFSFASLFVVSLFLLVIFLKKYHEGEVSVYTATAVLVAIWVLLMIESAIEFRSSAAGTNFGELPFDGVAWTILIFMGIVVYPFLGIAGLASWSIGENLARQEFAPKLASLDAIINRKFGSINIGYSILWGYCYGIILLAVLAILAMLNISIVGDQANLVGFQAALSNPFSFVLPAATAASSSLLGELIFRLFGNLYVFNLSRKKWLAILVSSFVWVSYVLIFWDLTLSFESWTWFVPIAFLVGVLLSVLFWYYDVLTVLIASFVVLAFLQVVPYFTNSSAVIFQQGLLAAGLCLLPLALMAYAFIRRDNFEYRPDTMPSHIKKITERERMARELEIAHQVQMSLLPKRSPDVAGCDIAGLCVPAKEVGGDYYDFISLGDGRLGIAIGDVSGKGVPAAIYMTLTKGIFQSNAEVISSPKEVLIRVNNLMYRTIERGSFVSMFYAVLDVNSLKMRFSRAGHNPALYLQSKGGDTRMLEPAGIALGLDNGKVFAGVINEQETALRKGDLLVFYTDGFTEAMNKNLEEYGEERLIKVLKANEQGSAKEIIDAVYSDVVKFASDYQQHDDMTMVVAKIL